MQGGDPVVRLLNLDYLPQTQTTLFDFDASYAVLKFSLSLHCGMSLYAIGPGSRVYHVVLERGSYTLCGLKVSGLKVNLPTRGTGLLYVLPEKPKDRKLCKHCERLKEISKHGRKT
jgi:hypothetical protein